MEKYDDPPPPYEETEPAPECSKVKAPLPADSKGDGANPSAPPLAVAEERSWVKDWFSVFDDPETCFLSFCCPCFPICKVSSSIDPPWLKFVFGLSVVMIGIGILGFMAAFVLGFTIQSGILIIVVFILPFEILVVIIRLYIREKIRKNRSIPGSIGEDLVLVLCCFCCTVAQERIEIREMGSMSRV